MSAVCRSCLQKFSVSANHATACRYHPESYSGETSQRWRAPGDVGGSDVQYFWTCCGASSKEAAGCVAKAHVSFDEEDETATTGRRPGMSQL